MKPDVAIDSEENTYNENNRGLARRDRSVVNGGQCVIREERPYDGRNLRHTLVASNEYSI